MVSYILCLGITTGYFLTGQTLFAMGNHEEALRNFIYAAMLTQEETQRRNVLSSIASTLAHLSKRDRYLHIPPPL